MVEKKHGLGRGLSDLGLSEILGDTMGKTHSNNAQILSVDINMVTPSPFQSRKQFNEEKLHDLAETIKSQGIIQPLLVRQITNNRYELIAGERRLRAGKLAGLKEVPCLVQTIDDATAAMINVLENLHREDLNVVEEAEGIRQLIEQHSLKHSEIATTLGQSRSSITNKLRLLSLSPYSLKALRANQIEMGHAKCLLSVDEQKQKKFVDLIIKRNLSVRKLESLLKSPTVLPKQTQPLSNPFIQKIESQLSKLFEAKTTIKNKESGKGKIVIDFKSSDHLDKIISLMTKIYVEQ